MIRWFLFALAMALIHPLTAHARPACTDRAAVMEHFAEKYHETPVAFGLANNGGVVEVLSSPDRATWTLIITMPNGLTCLIAAGKAWERVPARIKEKRL